MIEIIDNNIKYKLGKNARENFQLIDEAIDIDEDYWWFHLDDYSSGHCIIFSDIIDNSMIQFASNLIKNNSKQKNNKKIKIIYTQVKNVKKTKTIGQVIITKKLNYTLN